jgi:zinc carboxypeptidase
VEHVFVDTCFENGSPLKHQFVTDGSLRIEPLHDDERFTGNRQSTHWNFKLHVPPNLLGTRLKMVFPGTDNIWNGRRIQAMDGGRLNVALCDDGENWRTLAGTPLDFRGYGYSFDVQLSSPCVQIARNVPYTITDLNRQLESIASHPSVRVEKIGQTVEGRSLEIIELGNPQSRRRVLIRAAAHPWESGGTWFVDGMMAHLTSGEPSINDILGKTCFCIMPMANKDGVWRGMSRYNVRGIDLNRNWFKDSPADPSLAPENACLQRWLNDRQRENRLPQLAIDLHNDGVGQMHLGPHPGDASGYQKRTARLEELMREYTWFREGSKEETFRGSFGNGLIEIYGVDALIYELHSEWAMGLNRAPLHRDWQQLGASFVQVVDRYL